LGQTALFHLREEQVELIEILRELGLNFDHKDNEGLTWSDRIKQESERTASMRAFFGRGSS
jgi:hypothetical protein